MSRSFKQISVPNSRGRKTVSIKTKRRSSKLIRTMEEIDGRTDRILRGKFLVDKDNKSYQNYTKRKNYNTV